MQQEPVLHKKASEVNPGAPSAAVVGWNHRTPGNDESAYLDESCYMLGSAGCLTHMIACKLHSHEPLSGFPAALFHPILSVQQSSFEIASCFPYIKCQAFPGRILCHPPFLPVLRLWCLPFVSAGVLWYRVLRQANSQPVQPGTLFPPPAPSYY